MFSKYCNFSDAWAVQPLGCDEQISEMKAALTRAASSERLNRISAIVELVFC